MFDVFPIAGLLRGVSAVLLCAAAGPSCLLEFPERQLESGDAGAMDSGSDLGTIAQDRFDWDRFAAHGVLADPDGRLRAFYFTGTTGDDRLVTLGRLTLDDVLATPAPAQAPRSLGGGTFELRLPDVGELEGATIALTRDDASGLGTVRLESAIGWGGPIVLTRLATLDEGPGVDGPHPTRLVGVGSVGGRDRAALGFGAFGTKSFSQTVGVTQDGEALPPALGLAVDMATTGIFQILDADWPLRGAWLPGLRFFAAHRWNATSVQAAPDGRLGALPEIWFGMPVAQGGLGPLELAGRWRLAGIGADAGRWSGFGSVLEIQTKDSAVRYMLRSDAGGVDQDGHIDLPSSTGLPFDDVLALNPDDDTSVRFYGIGSTDPPMLLLWGMDGRNPAPRLLFGLREN